MRRIDVIKSAGYPTGSAEQAAGSGGILVTQTIEEIVQAASGGSPPEVVLPTEEDLRSFPADLAGQPAFGFWKYIWNGTKWDKPPCDARGHACDRAGFSLSLRAALEQAQRAGNFGVGCYPPPDFAAVDFDDCFLDDTTLLPPVADWVKLFESYTEYSPSGNGIHIWLRADVTGGHKTKLPYCAELYGVKGNYLTVTGRRFAGSTINERQAVVDQFRREMFPGKTAPSTDVAAGVVIDDDERLLAIIQGSAQGAKFNDLYYGDPPLHHSEEDMALCAILNFWLNNDAARVDYWFRRSKLMRPKWDKRRGAMTYGELTISKSRSAQPFGAAIVQPPIADEFLQFLEGLQ